MLDTIACKTDISSMRGYQAIYLDLFPEYPQKARNSRIDARDNLLLSRYYYYAHIRGFRFERCLEKLEKEHFISANAIVKRITKHTEVLKSMVAQKITTKILKQQYPHLVWEEL